MFEVYFSILYPLLAKTLKYNSSSELLRVHLGLLSKLSQFRLLWEFDGVRIRNAAAAAEWPQQWGFMQGQGQQDNGLILKYVSENSIWMCFMTESLKPGKGCAKCVCRYSFYNSVLCFFPPFWILFFFSIWILLTSCWCLSRICDSLQKDFPSMAVENLKRTSLKCSLRVSLSSASFDFFSPPRSTQQHQLLKEQLSWHCYFSSCLQRSRCRRVPQVVLSGSLEVSLPLDSSSAWLLLLSWSIGGSRRPALRQIMTCEYWASAWEYCRGLDRR